jgi:hypothetical protein
LFEAAAAVSGSLSHKLFFYHVGYIDRSIYVPTVIGKYFISLPHTVISVDSETCEQQLSLGLKKKQCYLLFAGFAI